MNKNDKFTLISFVIVIVFISTIIIALKSSKKTTNTDSVKQEIINNAVLLQKTVDDLIKIYDPKLSIRQGSYRVWLNHCNELTGNMLSIETFKSYEILNKNLNFLLAGQDSIRNTLLFFNNTLAEYGSNIKTLIPNTDAKSEFEIKWKLYMEGMTEVFNYDLEFFNNLALFFKFLKDNYSEYEIINSQILFESDAQVNRYNELLSLIDNEDNIIKQQEIRSACVHIYLEAISIAQIESKKDKKSSDKIFM